MNCWNYEGEVCRDPVEVGNDQRLKTNELQVKKLLQKDIKSDPNEIGRVITLHVMYELRGGPRD